ncbi:MAG: SDR family oxidoreductase [Alcaligenaceae bacterium]|nr:MAG: SDR family oxidoreductase [Alcaligenaceae bacterium]
MSRNLPAVLITGASSGIGAVYAERFAQRGHDLVLVARDKVRLDTLAEQIRKQASVNIDVLPADLTKITDLRRVEQRLSDDENIQILINNAGAVAPGGFANSDLDALDNLIRLNVTAVTRLASAAGTRFASRGKGAVVNISSILALIPEFNLGIYAATKSYVLTLSQSLQSELGPRGVYVQAVLPAATRTEIWERSGRSIDDLSVVMGVDELVDAALVGFDRREAVTIPSLPDARQWDAFSSARQAMLPNLAQPHAAARYHK